MYIQYMRGPHDLPNADPYGYIWIICQGYTPTEVAYGTPVQRWCIGALLRFKGVLKYYLYIFRHIHDNKEGSLYIS